MAINPWHPEGWVNQPITSETDITDWRFLAPYWYAPGERLRVMAGCTEADTDSIYNYYPAASTPYETFVSLSVVDNENGTWTLTATDTPTLDWLCGGSTPRWTNFQGDCDGNELLWAAEFHSLVMYLDEIDPRYVLRADIVGNTADSITIQIDKNWLLNQAIEDFEDIRCQIIRADGRSWAERFPEPPLDWQHQWGTCYRAFTVEVTGSEDFTLTVDANTTEPIPKTATAVEVFVALLAADIDVADVRGDDGGPFTVLFEENLDLTAVDASVESVTNAIYDLRKTWADDYWATAQPTLPQQPDAFDMIIQCTDNVWRRVPIDASHKDSVEFAEPDFEFEVADYYFVKTNAWWIPERRQTYVEIPWVDGTISVESVGNAWQLGAWYRGVTKAYLSHDPASDNLAPVYTAATQLARDVGEVSLELCEEEIVYDLQDNDVRNSATDVCGQADRMHAVSIHKSFRHLEFIYESTATSYIDEDFAESPYLVINAFAVATWFKKFLPADNWASATITAIDETVTIVTDDEDQGCTPETPCEYHTPNGNPILDGITFPDKTPGHPYTSLDCVWALIEDDGSIVTLRNDWERGGGSGSITADNVYQDSEDVILTSKTYTFTEADIGKTIIVAYGWSRFYALAFRYYYEQERRLIALDVDEENNEVWPPTADAPATWNTKGNEGVHLEYNRLGLVGLELGEPYRNGLAYQYEGDSFFHPTTLQTSAPPNTRDRSSVVRPGYATGFFNPSKVGTSTAGDTWYLEDSDVDWWEDNEFWTLEGTGGAGSNTLNVVDADIDIVDDGEDGDKRFTAPDNDTRWIGHVIEVSFDEGVTWEARVITGQSVAAGDHPKFTVTRAFSESTSDKPYRIKEPKYLRDRWRGRFLRVTNPTTHVAVEIEIDRSDNKRLFPVEEQDFSLAGLAYEIIEEKVGSVFHRHADKWKKPTPTDATTPQDTRGKNWHKSQFENEPSIIKNYGHHRSGDFLVYNNGGVLRELYEGINLQNWLFADVTLSSTDPNTELPAENNAGGWNEVSCLNTCESCKDAVDAGWADQGSMDAGCNGPLPRTTSCEGYTRENMNAAPYGHSLLYGCDTRNPIDQGGIGSWGNGNAVINRSRFMWTTTSPPTCFASKSTIWAYSTIDGSDHDEGPDPLEPSTNYAFNDNGTGAAFREWAQVYTDPSPSTDAIRFIRVGAVDGQFPKQMPYPARPAGSDPNTEPRNANVLGHYMLATIGITKFNVEGGFLFTDHQA